MKANWIKEQEAQRIRTRSRNGNGGPQESFRRDVLRGLSQTARSLPCKYLYDERGADLFEAICELEEYYPTRTEAAILRRNISQIAFVLGPRCRIIELGSGNSLKTRVLLDHLESPSALVPVDVAGSQLRQASVRLARRYRRLLVQPICADYTADFSVPPSKRRADKTVVLFLGSTIGNLEPDQAVEFLRRMARFCKTGGSLLIGVDLKKETALLNRAYNDSQGITAKFNLNLLARVHRELQSEFHPLRFQHHAFYNETAGRIEMHLVSRRPQTLLVGEREFSFAKDEPLVTEHSYKYSLEEFRQLATRADLEVTHCWTDPKEWFSLQLLVPRPS